MENAQYIPGVCNIGREEIRIRKILGWMGLLITIFLWILLAVLHVSSWWFLILFLPASLSASGFVQGFMRFCAGYGMRGLFNLGTEVGKTDAVESQEFRAKDIKRSRQIFGYSALIGTCVALAAFLVK